MSKPDKHEKEQFETMRLRFARAAKFTLAAAATAVVVSVAMPTKTTVIAIAASEAADMAINSPTGKEITDGAMAAINGWLKSQVEAQQPRQKK